jgi:transcriptional regulator with XRE-family HTH domain
MRRLNARAIVDDFGRRVGEARREREWTQAQLAERWGVSVYYVQLVERGRENMTLESIALLASVLRVKPASLLESPKSRARRRPGRPKATA